MKALSLYLTSLNRYRRSRGFGVHSPFAFYFIKRVIKETCRYYSYDIIDREAKLNHVSRSEARLLFRVANHFNPGSMLVSGYDKTAETTLKQLSVNAVVTVAGDGWDMYSKYMDNLGDDRPFIYVSPTTPLSDDNLRRLIDDAIERQGVVIVGGMKRGGRIRTIVKAAASAMTWGMTFSNGRTAVIIGNRKLPRQHFSLWF